MNLKLKLYILQIVPSLLAALVVQWLEHLFSLASKTLILRLQVQVRVATLNSRLRVQGSITIFFFSAVHKLVQFITAEFPLVPNRQKNIGGKSFLPYWSREAKNSIGFCIARNKIILRHLWKGPIGM